MFNAWSDCMAALRLAMPPAAGACSFTQSGGLRRQLRELLVDYVEEALGLSLLLAGAAFVVVVVAQGGFGISAREGGWRAAGNAAFPLLTPEHT